MKKKRLSLAGAQGISGIFIFLLIGVFAIFSITLVLTGVNVYRHVTESAVHNIDYQLALSYIGNKVRAYDCAEGIRIEEKDGTQVLCLAEEIEAENYETRIFMVDGIIYEQFTLAEEDFYFDMGQELTQVKDIRFTVTAHQALTIDVVLPDGSEHSMHMALRSAQVR